jgi:hypothetical protein
MPSTTSAPASPPPATPWSSRRTAPWEGSYLAVIIDPDGNHIELTV